MEKRITTYKLKRLLDAAFELFTKQDFENAFHAFESILNTNPTSKAARIGALLCDWARDYPDNALSLYEYYQFLCTQMHKTRAQNQVLDILRSVDEATFGLKEMFRSAETRKAQEMDGILYKDFLDAVASSGDFKRTFENIMFSTKIIFTSKSDFYDFLERLIKNDFVEIGLDYIDNIKSSNFGADRRLDEILKKAVDADNKKHKS